MLRVLAVPVMYFLSRRKLQVASVLGSRALRTDAVESITCGLLALVVVGVLVAQFFIDARWVDPLAFLEGREAWEGENVVMMAAGEAPATVRQSRSSLGQVTARIAPDGTLWFEAG